MKKSHNKGFTLVEVVIALALSVVTIGVIYSIYLSQVKAQVVREDKLDMQQHLRIAMAQIVQELHMAGYDPRRVNHDDNETNDFEGIIPHPMKLIINADLNGNGKPTDSNESIQFSHDQATLTLRRDTGGGRQPVAEHIEAFSLKYFDHREQLTTDSKLVRQIEITIKARTKRPDARYSKNGGHRTVTLQSRVTPRNLGL